MREGERTKEREQEREPQFLKEREKREIVQGLFFHLLPLFLESPFFLCVCANKTNTRCYKKTEEGAERERENGEEGERRGRESGLLEGEVEEHGRCLPSLTFCSSSLLRWGGGIALSPQVVSPLFFLFLSAAVLARLSFSPPSAQQLQRRLAKQGERGQKVPFIRTPMPTPSASSPRASAAASSAPSTSRSTIEDGTPLLQSE